MRKPKRLVVLVALVGVVLLVASACVLNGSWTALTPAAPTPPPGESVDAEFASVSCPTADFCMAVGASVTDAFGAPTIQTWDGVSWTEVAPPTPLAGFEFGGVDSVACTSASECFIVISHFSDDADYYKNLYTWDGSTWTRVHPDIGSSEYRSEVDCAPDGTCMLATLVGGDEYSVYDGESWERLDYFNSNDWGEPGVVGCGSIDFCTQATSWGDMTMWNGTTWSLMPPLPLPPGEGYRSLGLDCSSDRRCVALGLLEGAGTPVSYVWGGAAWTSIALPSGFTPVHDPSGFSGPFSPVSCPNNGECVAIGEGPSAIALVSNQWYQVAAPPAGATTEYRGVSCVTLRCVAVGFEGPANATELVASSWNWTRE